MGEIPGLAATPTDYQPGTQAPVIFWIYPREFASADAASQVVGSPNAGIPRRQKNLRFQRNLRARSFRIVLPRARILGPSCNNRMTLGSATSCIVTPDHPIPLPEPPSRAYVAIKEADREVWTMAARHLVTADELQRMGREDLELVRGELVPVMTPAGEQHGALAAFLTMEIGTFARAHDLGRVYVEVGYRLFSDPDTVRGPDVSFVSRKREATTRRRDGFIRGAPDLAIEIASSDKPMTQLTAKAAEYLEAGTRLVWVVDAEQRDARVYRVDGSEVLLGPENALEGEDVLPGFVCLLASLAP